MLHNEKALKQALKNEAAVYCFYSPDAAQLERMESRVCKHFAEQDPEETVLEGPTPPVEEIIAAAGTISFFSTRRLVRMPFLKASAYSDKDLKELCDTLEQVENAVFVITCLVSEEWGKLKLGKREQKLFAQCEKCGYCAQVNKPQRQELARLLQQKAEELGAQLPNAAAERLIDRCGENQYLLENEVEKVAALAGYQTITTAMVEQLATRSLEDDVFKMVQQVTQNQTARALKTLDDLLRMQNEPIGIAGALTSNYLDLYRASCAQDARRDTQALHKDFGYKGSPYRLKKAADTARRFSRRRLLRSLEILDELDEKLKSVPVDGGILLQKAICELAGNV